MKTWGQLFRPRQAALRFSTTRSFTANRHERVQVSCGSSGHVNIDLFNVTPSSSELPVIIHLPPFSSPSQSTSPKDVPDCFHRWPVASINYRWEEQHLQSTSLPGLGFPAPVHDVAFAYAWLVENLAPLKPARRDIYVYGSFLGASLATSLALTETHGHAAFGVRGVAAYNGIYNWTMFLEGHPVHRRKPTKGVPSLATNPLAEGLHMENLNQNIPNLFRDPVNLFDPFISPSLFFHSPGVLAPQNFEPGSSPVTDFITRITAGDGDDGQATVKAPRKSHMVFPPRSSTLKIPETLLLYDKYVARTPSGRISKRKPRGNTFMTQAEEIAELMRRSIDKIELKERSKWDDEIDNWEFEMLRRVQLAEAGKEKPDLSLGEAGYEELVEWLNDRL